MFIEFIQALWETLYMVLISGAISSLIGVPLGILLSITEDRGILKHRFTHWILSIFINGTRSIPFIILLVALIPLTRWLIGTSIGTTATIVPLTISAIPFVARISANAFDEVNMGLIEAGIALGATPKQIIWYILLPEALPAIINGITVTCVSLIGYSAMAGAVGGGGLGDLAIRYGYQRFNPQIILYTCIILIILVQLLQMVGDKIAKQYNHR